MQDGVLAQSDDDIVREARSRLKLSEEAESVNRTDALTALNFRNGDQWPVDVRRDRDTDGRPCLTINITDAVVRRVSNACRENRPRIKIDPVGDGADVHTAQVLNGLTRHIENISGADYAYDCAEDSAITGGWGWLSVTNDYCDEKSFDQDLLIQAHRNPFKIYADPASEMPDGSDMNWLLETELLPKVDYKELYGDIDPSWDMMGEGDNLSDWSTKEMIRVAKYWRKENKRDVLYQLPNNQTALKSQVKTRPAETLKERKTIRKVVKCYLTNGVKILKTWDWPGKHIPYVPVYGREMDINGKVRRKGMVKDLMDPARMYNYSETAKTEVYGLQPRAPWLGPEGFMGDHEAGWRDANRKPIVALEYKPQYTDTGELLPPPQRQEPPPLGSGFQEWSQTSQSNFMAVAGMPHDPNQDAKGEVVSGIALKRRQGMSDISHFDFYDNLTRSIRQLGRIIVDLFPHFYGSERLIRIVNPDGSSDMVWLNKQTADGIENNTQVGRYDVIVDTGPGYQTKREESTEAKLELLGTPLGEMVGHTAGDLIIRGMDFENADEIADRLQASIPGAMTPESLKDLPPKAQAMISGIQAQLQKTQQALQQAQMELKFKMSAEQMKVQGKLQDTQMKESAETDRTKMELGIRKHDVDTKERTAVHDTHVKATTALNVAEINAAGRLFDTHIKSAHEAEQFDRQLEHDEHMGERQIESAEGQQDKQLKSAEKTAAMRPKPAK